MFNVGDRVRVENPGNRFHGEEGSVVQFLGDRNRGDGRSWCHVRWDNPEYKNPNDGGAWSNRTLVFVDDPCEAVPEDWS